MTKQEFVVVHIPRLRMVFIGTLGRAWLFRREEKRVIVRHAFGPRVQDKVFWGAAGLARTELRKMRHPELQFQGASP